jgi:hypothetical protein
MNYWIRDSSVTMAAWQILISSPQRADQLGSQAPFRRVATVGPSRWKATYS